MLCVDRSQFVPIKYKTKQMIIYADFEDFLSLSELKINFHQGTETLLHNQYYVP